MNSIFSIEKSTDGTIKFIFEDNFHCVLIPHGNKNTLCVSSQVGCAMNCQFCLTAKLGFERNLTSEEIVLQFETALNYLTKKDEITRKNKNGKFYAHDFITSIVFMGMGEPFNNYNNMITSIDALHEEYFYSYKKITVSTSGIILKMKEFIKQENKIQLAVSFHSPFQEIRDQLMPKLKQYPIIDLVDACNLYCKKNKHHKIMIEYIMIEGLTDRDEDLNELLNLGFEKMTNFNLIPLNGNLILDGITYNSSSIKKCELFKEKLIQSGYKCLIRHNRGNDIEAACGMLN